MTKRKASAGDITPTEVALIARFLGAAAEEFDGHGSNDFSLSATEENKAIVEVSSGW